MAQKVYVIILNWNGASDTLACAESVLRSDYHDYQLVICDNSSTDDSITTIRAWFADGNAAPTPLVHRFQEEISAVPIQKPHLTELPAEASIESCRKVDQDCAVLIHTGGNLGYAGGNNCGIRFALARGDLAYVWLLNNDTVVDSSALSELVGTARQDPDCGMVGSTLRSFHDPSVVQALGGGWFNPLTGQAGPLRPRDFPGREALVPDVNRRLAYIVGASMLVSRDLLERVGLMYERYFLYFEELDWAHCAHTQFRLRWSPRSIVYHKEGATAGTGTLTTGSPMSAYYLARNRMRFLWRHAPQALPIALLYVLKSAVRAAMCGDWRRAALIVTASLGLARPPTRKERSLA